MSIKQQNPKFNKKDSNRKNLSVSFEFLTSNRKYNFHYFKPSQKTEKLIMYEKLFEIMETISKNRFDYFMGLSKNKGFEKINRENLNFTINEAITNDENIYVKRFNSEKYRIIFIYRDDVIYIIGLDFDYSAYNHG